MTAKLALLVRIAYSDYIISRIFEDRDLVLLIISL